MLSNKSFLHSKIASVALLFAVVFWTAPIQAARGDWQRRQVDWRMTGGSCIKAINYPQGKTPPIMATRGDHQTKNPRKKALPSEAVFRLATIAQQPAAVVFANVIDSPPVDGFIPWIAVAVTDERSDESELDAIPVTDVIGNYLADNPHSDYAIGIFDTGASIHVMGNVDATRVGLLDAGLVTSNTVEIFGVTGSVEAWVSYPLGIFIDGLGAIEPNGMLIDDSNMVGETNVSIAVGQPVLSGSPEIPTVIGSPMSVYFTAAFRNDRQITIARDGNEFTAPDIHFYEHEDPCIPIYSNFIPLELRPLGAISVQYVYDLEFLPVSPSVITGFFPTQSIFFVSSVDLYEGDKSAIDKTRFMLDTGAQVTVIGSRIAARLALNPADPDFEVEIQGITGDTIIAPGFYIDSLDIPALGEWLSFTNIPVILLDVPSPEGGTVDGIIGMNLFVDLNFVFHGGGLFLQDDPKIEYEPIYRLVGDIAPIGGDGSVDFLDIAAFAQAWLAKPTSPNWNSGADLFGDAIVNFLDFAILAEHWHETSP